MAHLGWDGDVVPFATGEKQPFVEESQRGADFN